MSKAPTKKRRANSGTPIPSPSPTSHEDKTDATGIWHYIYCDPLLDVVLKSKEGVYFRFSSTPLKRESTFFRDMFSAIPDNHMSVADAICLEFTSKAITAFLDKCYFPVLGEYPKADVHSLLETRTLFRYLDCDRFVPHIEAAFEAACHRDPISWLIIASDSNNLEEAALALARCCHLEICFTLATIKYTLSKVREAWQYPLLLSLLSQMDDEKTIVELEWPVRKGALDFVNAVRGQVGSEGEGQI